MKSLLLLIITFVFANSTKSQPSIVEPGSTSINSSILYSGKFTWASSIKDQISLITIQRINQEIVIEDRTSKKGIEESTQSIVLSAKTLEPLRENYKNEDRSYSLQYGTKIKGTTTDFESNKKTTIDEPIDGKHFNAATLSFIISCLPISLDYRVTLPILRMGNGWKPTYLKYKITDVSEQKSFSCLSGAHEIWKVTVQEKTRNHRLVVFFDKSTRRILRTEQSFDGYHLSDNTYVLADKETDVNPIKAKFNADETMAMLSGGSANINGQASTKIADKKGIAGNKTQYAPKGSLVTLIPNSAYFKEWVDYNLFIGNVSRPVYFDGILVEGCSYPLPPEVAKTMRVTDVTDNKGSFQFDKLKPGEYLVYIGFVANKYTHTTRTPTGDYSITINNDGSASATQIIDVKNWMTPQNIINHQYVKISNEGQTVNIKLK